MKRIRAVMLAGLLMMAVPARAQEKEEVIVPADVIAISEELGGQYGICPEIIQALAWRESRFQPDAEDKGCIGTMQIYEKYHKDRMKRLGVTDLYDMQQNMLVAVDYLAELFARYEDAAVVLAAYHGEKNIYQVSAYTESILELSEELERAHGK